MPTRRSSSEGAAAGGVADEVDPAAEPALLLAEDLDLAKPGAGHGLDRDPVGDLDDQLADPDPGLHRGGPGRDLELAEVEQEVADAQLVGGQLGRGGRPLGAVPDPAGQRHVQVPVGGRGHRQDHRQDDPDDHHGVLAALEGPGDTGQADRDQGGRQHRPPRHPDPAGVQQPADPDQDQQRPHQHRGRGRPVPVGRSAAGRGSVVTGEAPRA